ncbi:hypothetical protein CSB66_1843 [Enterobacter hormaechei]|uniref:hypothetical protein n=1 Tax=Enterobacter hormaechei TaxID=158836 RepID=UPI0007F89ABB|nr:hypothetical protein [Enterobacter hormaechei]RCG81035.1 hypothetical protein CSB66_1843 [Enterobacter hormaechei]
MKQKFIEWFTKNNNGCSPAMEDDRSFVYEMTQHMFEAYQAGVAEGEARCAALAAENAALNKFIKDDCWIWDDKSEEYFDAADCMPETPATDAFLAEVRAHGVKSLSNAVQSVISERQRQQSVEGWTPKHDDKHDNNELAFAASCYAFHSAAASWDFEDDGTPYDIHPAPKNWPWSPEWWKPKNPRRDLVKAGALILAVIERLDRAAAGKGE